VLPQRMTLTLLVALAACSSGDADIETRAQAQAASLSRIGGQSSIFGGTTATASYNLTGTEDVLIVVYDTMGAVVLSQWLDTVYGAEGVQLGTRSDGTRFCVVSTFDETTGTSYLVSFVDTNGDLAPDQLSRTTIATEPNTVLCRSALDRLTGTLYVIDGASQKRIIRYADSTGDLVPNGASTVFFIFSTLNDPSFNPVELERATATGVVARSSEGEATDYLGRRRTVHLRDDDSDGIAETSDYGTDANPKTVLVGRVFAGETTVDAYSDRTGNFEIRSSFDGSVLGSFGTVEDEVTVTLNRAAQENEILELHDKDASVKLGELSVESANALVVFGLELDNGLHDGQAFSITGRNLVGNETVEILLASSTSTVWTACIVDSITATAINGTLPTLSLTKRTRYVFRVLNADGESIYTETTAIDP